MELYMHRNRNIVVKSKEDGDKWFVKFVAVDESIAGNKRRGRHPDYSKALKSTEFTALDAPSDVLRKAAAEALAAQDAPEVAQAATEETAEGN